MTDPRPVIAEALEEGETLLWQGHPKPRRPISARANLIGTLFYSASALVLLTAYFVGLYFGHIQVYRLAIYLLIGTAAFLTYLGLKVTLLDRRRARARDKRTAYGITDRRVLALAGPYRAEVALGPELTAEVKRGGLDVAGPDAKLRLDRLADAKAAHEILIGVIEGTT